MDTIQFCNEKYKNHHHIQNCELNQFLHHSQYVFLFYLLIIMYIRKRAIDTIITIMNIIRIKSTKFRFIFSRMI